MKHIDALSFPELLLGRTVSFTGTVTRSALSQDLSSNILRCLNLEHQDLGYLDPELFKHWDLPGNAKIQRTTLLQLRTGWQRSQTDWSWHSQTLWIAQCFFPCPLCEVCHQARVPRAREKLRDLPGEHSIADTALTLLCLCEAMGVWRCFAAFCETGWNLVFQAASPTLHH